MIFLRKIILFESKAFKAMNLRSRFILYDSFAVVAMNLQSKFILNFLYLKNGKKIPEKGSKEGG